MIIVADKVVYKVGLEAKVADTGTEDSSDLAVPEEPPVFPTPSFLKPVSLLPPPRSKARSSQKTHWKDVDLSA